LANTLPACEPINRIVPVANRQNDSGQHRTLCYIVSFFLPTNIAKKIDQSPRQKLP
jgi:hypothetical protein